MFKKKANRFLAGLSLFLLLGGFVFVTDTTQAHAQGFVTCTPQHVCGWSFGNRVAPNNPGQWQVNGRVTAQRNGILVRAQVTQFTLGTRNSGPGSITSGISTVTAQSPWLNDHNDTSTVRVTGWGGQ
jgi:hypothetical protein